MASYNNLRIGQDSEFASERGYLVCTSASRLGVPGSNPIAAPKSYKVYPGLGILHLKIADSETLSHSGLLSFKKPENVLWTIAKNDY